MGVGDLYYCWEPSVMFSCAQKPLDSRTNVQGLSSIRVFVLVSRYSELHLEPFDSLLTLCLFIPWGVDEPFDEARSNFEQCLSSPLPRCDQETFSQPS
jgi:hypothetical protein